MLPIAYFEEVNKMPIIDLSTSRVSYKFEINSKFSIIRGDSATGKTTLCDLVQSANRLNSGVINKSDAKLMVLNGDISLFNTEKLRGYVVFIDDAAPVLRMFDYEKWMQQCDCYFVIISRSLKIGSLPVSEDSVYTMRADGKYHTLQAKRKF